MPLATRYPPVTRLLREPLLQFLLLGAALFAASGLLSTRTGDEPQTIVVTQGQIESMATGFSRTWQRPPTGPELEGLIRDHVREEVYCREAIALGFDRDDPVIRRRLRQKMEFVTEDVAAQAEPTDADLRAYLQAHPDAFRSEQRLSFSQIYLNPERRRETLARDIERLLVQLRKAGARADVAAFGDSFLLEHRFDAAPASEIAKQFGESFAAKLAELPLGEWQGPVESGYGVHLVLLTERTERRIPALDEVHDAVRREWANARRKEANESFYAGLLKRYTVTIEKPKSPDGASAMAAEKP